MMNRHREMQGRGRRDRSNSSESSSDCKDRDEDEEVNNRPAKTQKGSYQYTSSFFNFLSDFRAQQTNNGLPPTEVAKEAAKVWKGLSASDREPYVTAAAANRKKRGKGKPGVSRLQKARDAARKGRKDKNANRKK